MKFRINKWHLAAITIFTIISVSYFSPALKGYKLIQSDISSWRGMAQEILTYRDLKGDAPNWTNSMFAGMPAYLVSYNQGYSLAKTIYSTIGKIAPHPIYILLMSLIGFYVLFHSLKIHSGTALIGSILAAANTYFFLIVETGHNAKAVALAYTPFMLAGIFYVYDRKVWKGTLLVALGLGLQLTANHLQITYYTLFIIAAIGIYEFVKFYQNKSLVEFAKLSGFLMVGALIAISMRMTTLLVVSEYSSFSIRGKSELTSNDQNKTSGLDKDYATAWSYGIAESFTVLVPGIMGGSTTHKLNESSHFYKALVNNGVPANQAKQHIKRGSHVLGRHAINIRSYLFWICFYTILRHWGSL